MAQLHRIKWLHERLLKNRFPNCRELSEQFEISRRQALRDVEYLKFSLSAPIEYSHQKRGYFYTDRSFSLPTFFLTREERNTLEYLAQQYSVMPGSSAKVMSDFFQRLSGRNTATTVSTTSSSLDYEEVICKAIAYQRKLKIVYRTANHAIDRRIVHPYKIIIRKDKSYLFAFCERRLDFRVFLIGRICELTISNEQYVFHPDFQENFDLTNRSFFTPQKYTAKIAFSLMPYLNQFTQPTWDEESKILTFSFIHSENLFKKLINLDISYEDMFYRIISPNWLREKLKKKLELMIKILNQAP
ncbi:MAG TPA: transcriptional regulator [Thermotogota bacterium]|nr:transcriptional regulator [Thermotogota bacterium]HPR97159.1 transcriptional regulator [Thermotogota bacterium]